MQRWSADAIAFMRDASEYGDYNKNMLAEIQEYLPREGHVCDAGSGLSYLSAQIAGICKKVTSIELSEKAADFSRKTHHAQNLSILCRDINTIQQTFDAMVFSYFGRTNEVFRLSKKLCSGNTVIIKRDCAKFRFSINQVSRTHTVEQTAQMLSHFGVPYEHKTVVLEFGQPFRTLDDAVRFFELYDKSETAISEKIVLPRLETLQHPEYRFYLPQQRSMEIIVFQAAALPKEVLDE